MSRSLHIYDEDLAVLESLIPELCESLREKTNNAHRVKMRRVKEILSNVRWNYQPHTDIEIVGDCDEQNE